MHFSGESQLLPPRLSLADRGPPLLGGLPSGALHLSGFTFVSHLAISWRVQFFVVDPLSGTDDYTPIKAPESKKKALDSQVPSAAPLLSALAYHVSPCTNLLYSIFFFFF